MKLKSDKVETRYLDRKSLKGESAGTKKKVRKAEGKQPPKEGMGDAGEKMGRDRDFGRSLENAGQTARKVKARST